MKTDLPFSGPLNVVQVSTKRLKEGKFILRIPYTLKYYRRPSTPVSVE
jgi:hypothetical protein